MNRLSFLISLVLVAALSCPALALEKGFKGDTKSYGPVQDWAGNEVWVKAQLGSRGDTKSYGPLKDWAGNDVWIKASLGTRGNTGTRKTTLATIAV